MSLQRLFLTFGGAGEAPKASGTVGSFAGLVVGIVILHFLTMETLFMLTLAISIIGVFEINKYEKAHQSHDDGWIVIDEVAGMWIALMMVYSTLPHLSFEYKEFIAYLFAFASFRYFDIFKPSTIGKIDRDVKGGLGVMGDDILAGFAGGMLSILGLLAIEKIITIL